VLLLPGPTEEDDDVDGVVLLAGVRRPGLVCWGLGVPFKAFSWSLLSSSSCTTSHSFRKWPIVAESSLTGQICARA
jgi:hypothetical protein